MMKEVSFVKVPFQKHCSIQSGILKIGLLRTTYYEYFYLNYSVFNYIVIIANILLFPT